MHHAYLFTGPAHVGKSTLALQLAQAVNCIGDGPPCNQCISCQRIRDYQHADVRFVGIGDQSSDGGPSTVIGIDVVRDIIPASYLLPYEGKSRVFIFEHSESLSFEAANAILKVLEEPPSKVFFILLAEDASLLPVTVRSRCSHMELRPLPIQKMADILVTDFGVSNDQALNLARLSRGCVGWAIEAVKNPEVMASLHQRLERIADVIESGMETRFNYASDVARQMQQQRSTGREEMRYWLRWLRDVLLMQHGRAQEIVNVNWRLTLERQAVGLSADQVIYSLHQITNTLDLLELNANPRLVLESLMLEFPIPEA
jgi:DNA polymerase-3 subunit delta'